LIFFRDSLEEEVRYLKKYATKGILEVNPILDWPVTR